MTFRKHVGIQNRASAIALLHEDYLISSSSDIEQQDNCKYVASRIVLYHNKPLEGLRAKLSIKPSRKLTAPQIAFEISHSRNKNISDL